MCIFPSDGTNRIRFTGKSYQAQSQPDASGPPKTICFCDGIIIASAQELSIMKNELQAVINLGAVIGAVIGIINIFI